MRLLLAGFGTGLAAMLAVASGCEDEAPDKGEIDDPGLDNFGEGLCEADDTDEQHPGVLTVGEEIVEYVCTPGDQDWYAFDIPAATPLVIYKLTTDVQFTTVTYRVALISDAGGTVAGGVDPDAGRRPVNIQGVAYASGGGHRVLVENVAGIATDEENPYHLLVELLADPDPAEPNDGPEEATALSGCAEGYLAFLGDEDWYSFDVGAGQVVTVELRGASADGSIEPVYEIRPEGSSEAVAGGQGGAAHALPPGSYRLRVKDEGDGSDLENGYEVCVSMAAEADPFEGPLRNDRPSEDSAELGTEGCETGGRIGSLGDRDWYRVQPPEGTSPSSPSVFEARVQLEAPTERGLELALSLVKPHPQSPCAVDEDCLLLRGACRGQWDCPSFVCDRTANQCSGAGVCLPQGVCGATVWSSTLDDFDAQTTALTVRAPIFDPGDHWLLVHDFQDDEWDETVAYQVCWQALEETDANEPNGAWTPYGREDAGAAAGRSADRARRLPGEVVRNDVTGEIESVRFPCARGVISYPGDTDWFALPFPAEADQPTQTWHFEFAYSDSGSPLTLQYLLAAGTAGNWVVGWEEGRTDPLVGGAIPATGIWGRAECAYACHNMPRPFWLMVAEPARANWDPDNSYEVCLTAYPGCRPELCPCGPDRDVNQNQCPERDAEGVDG